MSKRKRDLIWKIWFFITIQKLQGVPSSETIAKTSKIVMIWSSENFCKIRGPPTREAKALVNVAANIPAQSRQIFTNEFVQRSGIYFQSKNFEQKGKDKFRSLMVDMNRKH